MTKFADPPPYYEELLAEVERLRTDRDYWRSKNRIPTNGCVCRFSDPEDGDELVAECEHHKGVREDLEAEVERLRADFIALRARVDRAADVLEGIEAPQCRVCGGHHYAGDTCPGAHTTYTDGGTT